jgi:hypothetical protein
MKTRQQNGFLSIVTLVQIVLLGTAGDFVHELRQPIINIEWLIVLAVTMCIVLLVLLLLYLQVFKHTKLRK